MLLKDWEIQNQTVTLLLKIPVERLEQKYIIINNLMNKLMNLTSVLYKKTIDKNKLACRKKTKMVFCSVNL